MRKAVFCTVKGGLLQAKRRHIVKCLIIRLLAVVQIWGRKSMFYGLKPQP